MQDLPEYFDEEDYEAYIKQRSRPRPERRLKRSHRQMKQEAAARAVSNRPKLDTRPRFTPSEVFHQMAEEDGARIGDFQTSFASMSSKNHLSNHEREWILLYLGVFYHDHLISDVFQRVKSGKEATVYCCLADPGTGVELLAGKVYHPRIFRSLKNDALYRQGRTVLDDKGKGVRGRRVALAMEKKTRFGQDLRHVSWLTNEYQTLQKLHAAGADVPKPYAQSDNAILMEYMGGKGWPAPTLINVKLSAEEAPPLFDRLMSNIELMLDNDLVHADLSAHNVLYWEGEVKIIDFPQAVDPYVNPAAFSLLTRDVQRICQYFAKYGIAVDPFALTREIWARCIPG